MNQVDVSMWRASLVVASAVGLLPVVGCGFRTELMPSDSTASLSGLGDGGAAGVNGMSPERGGSGGALADGRPPGAMDEPLLPRFLPDSTQYCTSVWHTSPPRPSLWLNAQGLFLLDVGTEGVVDRHDGQGWARFWSDTGARDSGRLVGSSSGALFAHSLGECEIMAFAESGQASCSGVPASIVQMHVPDEGAEVAVGGQSVYRFDALHWERWGEPLPEVVTSVWSSGTTTIVGTKGGIYSGSYPGQLSSVSAFGDEAVVGVWGQGERIWAISGDGVVRTRIGDGPVTTIGAPNETCGGPERVWGIGERLFVQSSHTLAAFELDGSVTSIEAFACDGTKHISGLAGDAVGRVYYTIVDDLEVTEECSAIAVWVNDGLTSWRI